MNLKKEKEIIKLIAEGYSNKGISQILNISICAVKSHVKIIMLKLQARSRVDIAAYYYQHKEKFVDLY